MTTHEPFLRQVNFSEFLENAGPLVGERLGLGPEYFVGVSAPSDIRSQSLVICNKSVHLESVLSSDASVVVVSMDSFASLMGKIQDDDSQKPCILSSINPELLLAKTLQAFILKSPEGDPDVWETGIHPTSVIHRSAQVSQKAHIGPYVIVGEGVKIADGVYVGPHCVIDRGSEIGVDTFLHPFCYIGARVKIGNRCEIQSHSVVGKEGFGYAHDEKGNHIRIPHQGGVSLGDEVHLGASVCIDRGTFGQTHIANGVKIDNHVHIAHNCEVGEGSLLTAFFKIAGSSKIGKFFVAGGDSSVTGHVRIADFVKLGGLSVVSKDIVSPGEYAGFPLTNLRDAIKIRALLLHLPELQKQVKTLMAKVFGGSDK